MFCKRLSLRFVVPAFLSKLLYSELKSLKINRRIRLSKRSSLSESCLLLLMLDGHLVHFPALKSHNAKEIVFKIDTPVCISPEKQLLWLRSSLDDKESGIGTWSMTAVSWKIFRFHALIPHKRQKKISLCRKCFAILILGEQNCSDVVQIRSFNG